MTNKITTALFMQKEYVNVIYPNYILKAQTDIKFCSIIWQDEDA